MSRECDRCGIGGLVWIYVETPPRGGVYRLAHESTAEIHDCQQRHIRERREYVGEYKVRREMRLRMALYGKGGED